MKTCSRCKKLKADKEFTKGLWCRDCRLGQYRAWYLNHKEERHQKYLKQKQELKEYRRKNKELLAHRSKNYYCGNKDKVREQHRIYRNEVLKYKPKYMLSQRVFRGLRNIIKKNAKTWQWAEILGYTADDFRKHLEKQFEKDMTWEKFKRGEIQIDHIIPVWAFNYNTVEDIDFKKCWSLSNLRPLWKEDNVFKGKRLDKAFQPSLAF